MALPVWDRKEALAENSHLIWDACSEAAERLILSLLQQLMMRKPD